MLLVVDVGVVVCGGGRCLFRCCWVIVGSLVGW